MDSHFQSYSIYANAFAFAGTTLSRNISSADAVVLGVPYDLATSGRSGARGGPQAIRQASINLRWQEQFWPWDFVLQNELSVIDYGDIEHEVGNSADMMAQVEKHVSQIIKSGKTVCSMGGDHFISFPLVRCHAKHYGTVALLHFDAHTDTESISAKYNHGSMFHYAATEGWVDAEHSVQVGIRTEYFPATHKYKVIDAHKVNEQSIADSIQTIRNTINDRPVYVTFDIDALDPCFAPGTGTPVVGGLSTSRALQILEGLKGLNIVGCDVVEVAPAYDISEITALAGATILHTMLHLIAHNSKNTK